MIIVNIITNIIVSIIMFSIITIVTSIIMIIIIDSHSELHPLAARGGRRRRKASRGAHRFLKSKMQYVIWPRAS